MQHTFSQAGTYSVSLTVRDNNSGSDVETKSVTVSDVSGNELQNGVTISGLSGDQAEELQYFINVPADAANLTFNITGGSGDADLYVKFGSEPTASDYDCRPYRNGNQETCNVTNVQAGRYFVMLRGYRAFSGVSLTASYTKNGTGGSFEQSDLSGAEGQWQHFAIQIPAGMSSLNVEMSGGNGDADLYVRKGSEATLNQYDCRPYRWGNNETCAINNPAADTWYISIRGYSSFSDVNISAQWN
ncbi:MAG: pre-peptidase C-terminal domain-containing protein [Gammaproteobacteria bacterium]|nr:pre-peptidase C-terminal domain-containing protein [Gammaproteobacteria bacterium]